MFSEWRALKLAGTILAQIGRQLAVGLFLHVKTVEKLLKRSSPSAKQLRRFDRQRLLEQLKGFEYLARQSICIEHSTECDEDVSLPRYRFLVLFAAEHIHVQVAHNSEDPTLLSSICD